MLFDVGLSLRSGQFFRYYEKDGWFFVTYKNFFFKVRMRDGVFEHEGAPRGVVRHFFGLDQPYDKIVDWNDSLLRRLVGELHGLRVLQQDAWECLCAFVLSSASNIPRITKGVGVLSTGERLVCGDEVSHAFPRPGELSGKAINDARLGFRAGFLRSINDCVSEKWLRELEGRSYDEVLKSLMSLHGVGVKIADCVALFSLQKFEAFPIDVWIRRVMAEHYTGPVHDKQMKIFAQSHFGEYAGYAQQFLYEWVRRQAKLGKRPTS